VPYEEFDRLKGKTGLAGVAHPVSDIGMIFITNVESMLDSNARLAMIHSIDKKAIVDKLLRGYGRVIDTLEAPQDAALDPSIKVKYDPELAKQLLSKSGFSPSKPVNFTIQITRGFKPKDYEMSQAVVGMWRKVGIEASLDTYEVAKHFELRTRHGLAPAAFYNWGNSTGDPSTSTGFAMFSHSPLSAWKTEDVDKLIGPLWGDKNEAKRIAGYKAADRSIAENGYVIPPLQYSQPVVHKSSINFTRHVAGFILPQSISVV
jgi:peptide/nickel transport system substrate-binding protein